jgi:hypothetical protein
MKSVRLEGNSVHALYDRDHTMTVMDAVAILLAVAFVAIMLVAIKGIDRI